MRPVIFFLLLTAVHATVPAFVDVNNAPTTGGTSLTVTGSNFGGSNVSPTARTATTVCQTTSWVSSTAVACLPSSGLGGTLWIGVDAAAARGTSISLFSFDAPLLSDVSSTNAATSGVTSVTVSGSNFGVVSASPTVRLLVACTTSRWISVSQVTCMASAGTGAEGVTVVNHGFYGTITSAFTFNAPAVTGIPDAVNAPTSGSNSITISGSELGTTNSSPTVKLGTLICMTSAWISATSATCSSPQGNVDTGTNAEIVVDSLFGTLTSVFSYNAPLVTSLSETNAATTAGGTVTVTGSSFGTTDTSATARVGSTVCQTSKWITNSAVVCATPRGFGLAQSGEVATTTLFGTMTKAFSFSAPTVTSVGQNQPATGGYSLTLMGSNFGNIDSSATVHSEFVLCTTSRWVSHSHVTCRAGTTGPAVPGAGKTATVTAAALIGTALAAYSYDSPVVTTVSALNSPTSGVSSMTLSGSNLGATNVSPTARVKGIVCATSVWISTTSTVCNTPASTGSGIPVELASAALFGTLLSVFTHDAPLATSLSDTNAPNSAGASVTVAGSNFGTGNTSPSARIAGTNCATAAWISVSSVSCFTVMGEGHGHNIKVTTDGTFGTTTKAFTFNSPLITSAGYNAATTKSTSITLDGHNFSITNRSPTAKLGLTVCATSQWVSLSSVTCSAGSGVGDNLKSSLEVGSLVGTLTKAFSYSAPTVTSFSANLPATGGTSLTLHGNNFGPANPSPTAHASSVICATTKWISATTATCKSGVAPALAGAGMDLSLTAATLVGTGTGAFSFDAPHATLVAAVNYPSSGGSSFTVSGSNFGAANSSPTVRPNAAACSTSKWISATTAVCLTPAGSGLARPVELVTDGTFGTWTAAFTFDAPVATLNDVNTPTSGMSSVTISGTSFGTTNVSPTVRVTHNTCATSQWLSVTAVTCSPNAHYDPQQAITVYASSLSGTNTQAFSYDSPTVTSVGTNGATTKGSSVTITGSNFATTNQSPTGKLGLTVCATSKWLSKSAVSCSTNSGVSAPLKAAVYAASLVGTATKTFSYNAPVISSFSLNLPATGGTSMTLSGDNFGVVNSSPTAHTTSVICATTKWISHSTATCKSSAGPALAGPGMELKATVAGVVGTVTSSFSFDAPTVSSLAVVNYPTSGVSSVTVSGSNFGASDSSATARTASVVCSTSKWLSLSTVVCASTAGVGIGRPLELIADGSVGTRTFAFTFDSAAVTFVSTNLATSGGASLTISAGSLGATNASPTVMTGKQVCPTTKWLSVSSAVCLSASGWNVGQEVISTVAALISTHTQSFSFDAPVVSFQNPNAPASGATSVTISGNNFSVTNVSPTAKIGLVRCATSAWISNTAVACRVNSGYGTIHNTEVSLQSAVGTMSKVFTFDAPSVTIASTNHPQTGGASMSIFGTSFGVTNTSPTVHAAGVICGTSKWYSTTAATCLAAAGPALPGAGMDVFTTVASLVGTQSSGFSFDAPTVSTTAHYNFPTTGGTSLTVSGSNFGVTNASPTARTHASVCGTSKWFSTTTVMCLTTASTGLARPVEVVTDGSFGTATAIFTYDSAVVTYISTNVPTTGGASLTLSANNFGATNPSLTAHTQRVICATSRWISSTSSTCKVAAGSDIGREVIATVSGVLSTMTTAFSFDAPLVTLTDNNSPASGSASVTLRGLNFAVTNMSPTGMVGQAICKTSAWVSQSTLVCSAGDGSGTIRTALVALNSAIGTASKLFTFNAPVVTIATTNQPATGGASVTINGVSFGTSNTSPTFHTAFVICATSSWVSNTAATCSAGVGPALAGSAMDILSTVDSIIGTRSAGFSFDSPLVSQANVHNAPTSGGASVTVSGSNFGAVDSSATARVASLMCSTSKWISVTTVACSPAPQRGLGEVVEAVVDGSFGTATALFTFDTPGVTYITTNLPTTSGGSLTVSGSNFATVNASPTVHAGAMICSTTTWLSSSAATCLANTGAGTSRPVTATVSSLLATMTFAFSFNAPIATFSTSINHPTTGTTSVTLRGSNFGAADASPSVFYAGICATTSWVSSTASVCSGATSTGYGVNAPINAALASAFGTFTKAFTYNSPVVSFAVANQPSTGGASVTVSGSNFASVNASPTVYTSILVCSTSAWISATSATCSAKAGPPLPGGGKELIVAVDSLVATMTSSYSYDAAVVSYVPMANSPTTGGTSITLTGSNFGAVNVSPTAHASAMCTTSRWLSGSSVECLTDAGHGPMRHSNVIVAGLFGSYTQSFSYDAATVSYIPTFNNPTTGGGSLTVNGFNFGAANHSPSVKVNGVICSTSLWLSISSLTCTSPGYGAGRDVQAVVSSLYGTLTLSFTFNAPDVTLFQGASNVPTTGGASVTVSGNNFATVDVSPTVRAGDANCRTSSWVSASAIKCSVGGGSGVGRGVFANTLSLYGTYTSLFSFDSPVVSTVQVNSPSSGGASLTMSGMAFGNQNASPTATIGNNICQTSSWVSASSLACQAAVNFGGPIRSTLITNGLVGTNTQTFSYDSPVVSFVLVPNTPQTAGASVTISGNSFALVNKSPTASVGAAMCTTSKWVSTTATTCLFSTNAVEQGVQAAINVAGFVGTQTMVFTYDAVVVTVATPNVPSSSITSFTVAGLNFGTLNVSPTVRVGVTICATTQWISVTTVTCAPTAGAGLATAVATLKGVSGTTTFAFSYDAPVLTDTPTYNGPTTGGASVTVHGHQFGVVDSSLTVSLDVANINCGTTKWLSATTAACLSAVGHGVAENVLAAIGTLVSTQTKTFSFDSPAVSFAAPANGASTAAASFTLSGSNFGSAASSPTVQIASTICKTSQWLSSTTITCSTPRGLAANARAIATVDGALGTLTKAFSYNSPALTAIYGSNSPSSAGVSLTLQGQSFGVSDLSPTATVKGVVCATSKWVSASSVQCAFASTGTGGVVYDSLLEVSGIASTQTHSLSYDAPAVTAASSWNLPTSAGASVTMSGTSFGAVNTSPTGQVNSAACTTSTWISQSSLACFVSASGHGANIAAQLVVSGFVGTNTRVVTYDAPGVTYLAVFNAATSGHASLTLSGGNFGATNASPTGTVSSAVCGTSQWLSASTVVCEASQFKAPFASVNSLDAKATVSALISTLTNAFSYDSPAITATMAFNAVTTGTTSVTLSGASFGDAGASPTVGIQSTLCMTSSWVSSSSIVCAAPYGSSGMLASRLTVSSLVGTSTMSFTYNAPVSSALHSSNMATTASVSVTLSGSNFGATAHTPTVVLGLGTCTTAAWVSSSSLTCQPVAGSGHKHATRLVLDSAVGTYTQSFSFDSPLLTNNQVFNAPTTQPTGALTLSGSNLGATNLSPTVSLGSTLCATSRWLSVSSVTCGTPSGTSLSHRVAAHLSGLVGTKTLAFSYDAPLLTALSAYNSPITNHAVIEMFGSNMGTHDSTPTTTINLNCLTASWTSSSAISCMTGSAGYDLPATGTISGLTGTNTKFFTYDSPAISYLYPNNMPVTMPSLSVTLTGNNFGLVDYSATVAIGSSLCSSVSWVSVSSATCGARAGHSLALTTTLRFTTLIGTRGGAFSYDAPLTTGYSTPNAPLSSGTSVTLEGSNFGNFDFSPSSAIGVTPCHTTVWTSNSHIVCKDQAGVSPRRRVSVITSGLLSTATAVFSFNSPTITSLSHFNAPSTGGPSLTVRGQSFGTQDYTPSARLSYNGHCITSTWLSDSSMTCKIGPGARARSVQLQLGEVVGTMTRAMTYDSPTISYVYNLQNGPSTRGATLTMSGMNLGGGDFSPTAHVGETACTTSLWVSATTMTCASPAGSGPQHRVTNTVQSLVATMSKVFTFNAPGITTLAAVNGAHSGLNSVTVIGSGFSTVDASPTATIGSSLCGTSQWVSDSAVRCATPVGTSLRLRTSLTTSGLTGTATNFFSFDAPVATSLSLMNHAVSAGLSITLFGSNFGVTDRSATAGGSNFGVPGQQNGLCSTSMWLSGTALTCGQEPGRGALVRTHLITDTLVGTLRGFFTYDAPGITTVTGGNSPVTAGGTSVTLHGHNFGLTSESPTARVGNTVCATSAWISGTTVSCFAGKGTGSGLAVTATLGGVVGTKLGFFTYNSPVLTAVAAVNSPISGASVTLVGSDLGTFDGTPAAFVGSTLCATSQWISTSSVACLVVPGTHVRAQSVRLHVLGLAGTLTSVFSFNSPVVSAFTASNAPSTSGTTVTFAGASFGHVNASPTGSLAQAGYTTSWVSDSAVKVLVRPGYSTHTATVASRSLLGTHTFAFTYDSPTASYLVSSNAPVTAAGTALSLAGLNFGNVDASPTARVGLTLCSTTVWVSATSSTCSVLAGLGRGHTALASVAGLVGTTSFAFSYDSPLVSAAATPNAATSGGSSITLAGGNFATADLSPTSRVGATLCGTTSWLSVTAAVCLVGRGTTKMHALALALPGQLLGTRTHGFSYNTPVITGISHTNLPASVGASLTLTGSEFAVVDTSGDAFISATSCVTTGWTSQSSISCFLPDGLGKKLSVSVEIGMLRGTTTQKFDYDSITTYVWKPEAWRKCSTSCGPGTQTRDVSCSRVVDGVFMNYVDYTKCDITQKDATSRACQDRDVNPVGVITTSTITVTPPTGAVRTFTQAPSNPTAPTSVAPVSGWTTFAYPSVVYKTAGLPPGISSVKVEAWNSGGKKIVEETMKLTVDGKHADLTVTLEDLADTCDCQAEGRVTVTTVPTNMLGRQGLPESFEINFTKRENKASLT